MAEQQDPFKEFGGKAVKETGPDPFAEFGGTELKKKGSSSVSENTGKPLKSGYEAFQTSPLPIPSVLIGEARQKALETVKRRKAAVASQPDKKEADGGMGASFMAGLNKFNEGLFKAPKMIFDLASVPQNAIAELTNHPEWKADYDEFVNSTGYQSPLSNLRFLGMASQANAKEYEDQVKKYDKGVFESIKSGNYKDAGEQVLNNIAGSAPSIAGMYLTGGAGSAAKLGKVGKTLVNSLPFSSSKNAELEGRDDVPAYIKPINAAMNGLSEVVFDQEFGTKAILDNVILSFTKDGKEAAAKIAKDFVTGYVEKAVKRVQPLTSTVKNAIEEMSTQLSQNIVDKATINPDLDITQGIIDAGIIGGVTGGGIQTVGNSLSGIYNSKQKQAISKEVQLRNDLVNDLDNDDLDDTVKDQLADELEKVNDRIAKISDQAEAKLAALPEKEQAQAAELQQQIASIETSLENSSISPGTKEALTSQLQVAQDKLDVLEETSTKLQEAVLTKAEDDLSALKQVNNKVAKYEASMKRLTDAKNARQISEAEFNDLKSRFDDVMGDSLPKSADVPLMNEVNIEENIENEPVINPEENAIQEQTADEVPVQPVPGDSGEMAEGIPPAGPEVIAEESESSPEEGTALKNADVEARRVELGLGEFDAVTPQSQEALVDETTTAIREEGFDAKQLIDDILNKDKGKAVTPEEVVALKQYQLTKDKELTNIDAEITKSVDNETAMKSLIAQRTQTLNELNDSFLASKKAGTIQARAFNARKIKMLQDFSLANMFIRKFDANGGKALTGAQQDEVTRQYKDISSKTEAYDTKVAELEAKIAELEAKNVDNLSDAAYKRLVREQKKAGQVRKREAIQKDIADTLEAIRKKLKNQRSTLSANPIPVEMVGDVLKLAKLYAESGVLSVQEVADSIYAELKDTVEDLTVDHIKAIIAGGSDPRLKSFKTRTRNRIEELRNRTNAKDFKKMKRQVIKLDEEALELRDALEKAKYEYDVAMYKDELARREPEEKLWDTLGEVSGLFRAAKATADLSAVLRQGLVRTVSNTISRNPTKGVRMFWEMLRQTVSEKRYNRWMYDLQSSPEYAKMLDAGLYIADIKNPKLTAREEAFQSNWINHIPYYGKESAIPEAATKAIKKISGKEIKKIGGIVKGSERAYASYLNMQRVDVFMKLSMQMEANEKTFESDPQAFKEAARFANEVTGRGDLGPVESWKGFLSFALFSPRLMASRIRLLTNPINPVWWRNTPAEVKREYVKDMGKLAVAAAVVLWAAAQRGYEVEDDPTSSDFLKLRDGDTRLDVLGGFGQYITFGARERLGRTTNSFGEQLDLTNPQTSYDPTGLSVASRFGESKLSPFVAMTLNLARGKDYLGNKYTYKDVWKEMLPLSVSDKVVSMVDNDPSKLQVPYKYLPISLLGVGTSAYPNRELQFPANDTVEGLNGEKIKLTDEQVAERQKLNDEFILQYGAELKAALEEAGKPKSDIHTALKSRANKYSEAMLKEKYNDLIK
jgi:hypothetical protein